MPSKTTNFYIGSASYVGPTTTQVIRLIGDGRPQITSAAYVDIDAGLNLSVAVHANRQVRIHYQTWADKNGSPTCKFRILADGVMIGVEQESMKYGAAYGQVLMDYTYTPAASGTITIKPQWKSNGATDIYIGSGAERQCIFTVEAT